MDSDFTSIKPREDPPEDKHHPHVETTHATHDKPETTTDDHHNHSPKKSWRAPLLWFKGLPRKQQYMVGGGIVVVIIGLSVGGVLAFHHPKKVVKAVVPVKAQPKPAPPAPIVSRLDGLTVTKDLYNRPVTAIMIENSPDARPQSGIINSGVIFEAIAEGGITRFLTLHEEDEPTNIGPVRSVRPYYIDWLQAFDAPVAHAGGSTQGLAELKAAGIKDLDEFYNGDSYERISTRYAPHNLYTSTAKLDALEASKGYTSSNFTGFPRKKAAPLATPTAKTVDFAISGYLYNVHYDYDSATNSYKRSEGGQPHIDADSGAQLAPKVVIAIVMHYSIDANGVNSDYNSIGNGPVYVFQDGGVTVGSWQKNGAQNQITFLDSNNKPIPLDPGQTWITAVNGTSDVTYKP